MNSGASIGTSAYSGLARQAASLDSRAVSAPRSTARWAFEPKGVKPASRAPDSSSTASPSV
jgi:hypothetical protein